MERESRKSDLLWNVRRCFGMVVALRPRGLSRFSWTRLGRGYLGGELFDVSNPPGDSGEIKGTKEKRMMDID